MQVTKQIQTIERDVEHGYDSLLDEANIGIFCTAPDGQIRQTNAAFARILGYKSAEALSRAIYFIDDVFVNPKTYRQGVKQQANCKDLTTIELLARHCEGRQIWVSCRVRAVCDPMGYVQSYEGILQDISEHKASEQQRLELARTQERVQVLHRFISRASHDFLTPLSVMRTSLYLLERKSDNPEQLKRISVLNRQTEQIEKLINDMIRMAKLRREDFHICEADLQPIIEDVIVSHKPLLQERNQTILFKSYKLLARVLIDPAEIKFVIHQLISNALAHSHPDQTVIIETSVCGNEAMLTVSDDGEGIHPGDLPHIFEPFYRAYAREPEKGGVGIGLTIAKWIIDAHNGRIEVESLPGEGSTFRVYMPTIESKDQQLASLSNS